MRERKYFYAFYALQASALLAVLFPFLRWNNLLEWDFPGHYAAIWYLRNFLLPWPTGWNPFFYCGFPQGTFYPPLAHYIAALLSLGLGIGPAMKLMVAAALLLLPVSFYYFTRKWGCTDLQAAVCATWMTAVLFIQGSVLGTWNLGSDLRSFLVVGLFANSISLPVLFSFMGTLGNDEAPRGWKWAAALLGALFLLHAISALIAGFLVLSLLIDRWWAKSTDAETVRKPLLPVVGVGLLIGAAWLLPFLSSRGAMAQNFSEPRWSPAVVLIVLNGLILAVIALRSPRWRPLGIMYVLIANFIMAGTLRHLELEFSRLTIYLMLLIPILALHGLRSRVALWAVAALALVTGAAAFRAGRINPSGVPGFPMPDFGPVAGRILSVAPPSHVSSYHVHHDLIPLRTGNLSMLGLFIQSSPNGRFAADLTKTLDPDAYVWGTPGEAARAEALGPHYPAYVLDRLRLFDIRWIYTDLRLEDTIDPALALKKRYVNSYPAPKCDSPAALQRLRARYNTHGEFVDFYLYPVAGGALAEPLSYVPGSVRADWESTARRWFLEQRGVPVFTDREIPAGIRGASVGESVELLGASPRMDRIALRINACQDIPVLVKVAYFPTWRLTIDGRPAQVYRASPNLILIFAHGNAVLELKRPWAEYAGLALSVLGIVLLIALGPRYPLRPR